MKSARDQRHDYPGQKRDDAGIEHGIGDKKMPRTNRRADGQIQYRCDGKDSENSTAPQAADAASRLGPRQPDRLRHGSGSVKAVMRQWLRRCSPAIESSSPAVTASSVPSELQPKSFS